jgi:hypothetical protein
MRTLSRGSDGHASCAEPPYFEHLWGMSALYRNWGALSDIVDGHPVNYGSDSEAIADRELKQAAQDWFDMPRTRAGLESYIQGWDERIAALRLVHGPVRNFVGGLSPVLGQSPLGLVNRRT